MSVVHFLLVYDRNQLRLVKQEPFTDSHKAVDAYEAAEEEHGSRSGFEIVLVGADSMESVMLTHGN